MSLNIKNEETCRLARELAQLTGESMTGAITVALRERLERETHERRRSRMFCVKKIFARSPNRCAARISSPGPSAVEHGDYAL